MEVSTPNLIVCEASNTTCFRGDTSVHFEHQKAVIPASLMTRCDIARQHTCGLSEIRELDEQL